MIIEVLGELSIRTVHGSNGDFKVGRLVSELGNFIVKDAELEQYKDGKYEGKFSIKRIGPYSYYSNERFVIEVRATLDKIVLSGTNALSAKDADAVGLREVDPADEETSKPAPIVKSDNPLEDTTQFGADIPTKPKRSKKADSEPAGQPQEADEELFGVVLWPLGDVVKLDSTVDRRKFKAQIVRLQELGYEFDGDSQDWHKIDASVDQVPQGEVNG